MDRITLPPEPIRQRVEALSGAPPAKARWTVATGGLSAASVWRLDGGETSLAIRCWGVDADRQRVGQIAQTLRAIHQAGLSVIPAPIGEPIEDGATGLWERAPWRLGTPLSDSTSDSAAIEAAATGLATFHRLAQGTPGGGLRAITVNQRLERLEKLTHETPPIDQRTAEAWPESLALRRELVGAAQRARAAMRSVGWGACPPQTVHGDARPEHFLIEGGELTGLIDFGAMRCDTPWADVARLAGELGLGDAGRTERVVLRYEEARGKPVDRAAIAALDLAGAVLSAGNWTRWLSDPSREWPDPELVRERLRSVSKRLAAG